MTCPGLSRSHCNGERGQEGGRGHDGRVTRSGVRGQFLSKKTTCFSLCLHSKRAKKRDTTTASGMGSIFSVSAPQLEPRPTSSLYNCSVMYNDNGFAKLSRTGNEDWRTMGDLRRWLLKTFQDELRRDGVPTAQLNDDVAWSIVVTFTTNTTCHVCQVRATDSFEKTFQSLAMDDTLHVWLSNSAIRVDHGCKFRVYAPENSILMRL